MRTRSNKRLRLLSRSASMRSSTAGRALAAEVIVGSEVEVTECPAFAGHDKWKSPPQNAAKGSAHDGAADRAAHRAADRLADVGGDLAGKFVGHRAGDLARDQLSCRQTLAARPAGAEDRTEHTANLVKHTALLFRR